MTNSTILPRLAPRDRTIANLSRFLSSLPQDKAWRVEVSEHRRERSSAQLRYLNGVAYKAFGDYFGWDRDETSRHFCGEFFGWKETHVRPSTLYPTGIRRDPIRTTTINEHGDREVMNTVRFMDYVAFVQRHAAEHGVYIPDPNEGTL